MAQYIVFLWRRFFLWPVFILGCFIKYFFFSLAIYKSYLMVSFTYLVYYYFLFYLLYYLLLYLQIFISDFYGQIVFISIFSAFALFLSESTMQMFYKDKGVFLTGGTGFFGKSKLCVCVKKLQKLWAKTIYILMLENKIENAKELIWKIFWKK